MGVMCFSVVYFPRLFRTVVVFVVLGRKVELNAQCS